MQGNSYQSPAQRIGKFKGDLLAHAIPKEVLSIACTPKKMPRNMSDTIIFRRFLPFGGSTGSAASINTITGDPQQHQLTEGVTPDEDSVSVQDITVVLKEYGCLYGYTNKNAELGEDNIPVEQKAIAGERMGLVRELIKYGAAKACTNKFYAGGTTRGTTDEAISLNLLRKVSRSLKGNRGKMVTRMLAPSTKFNTKAVEASFVVFTNTDVESDIRDLPGFVTTADYGSMSTIHECEIGSVDNFRFVVSPELSEVADSGALIGVTGLYSTTGTNIDVFPCIVCAMDALGDVALRGANSVDPTHIPVNVKSKEDPLGQKGYVGCRFWSAAKVLNDGWMAVVEVGVSALD